MEKDKDPNVTVDVLAPRGIIPSADTVLLYTKSVISNKDTWKVQT